MSSVSLGPGVGSGAGGSGDVASALEFTTDNSVIVVDGATGKNVKEVSNITMSGETMVFDSIGATTESKIQFKDSIGTIRAEVISDHDSDQLNIVANDYNIVILTGGSDIIIETTNATGSIMLTNILSPDTQAHVKHTQGAHSYEELVGNQNPEGNIIKPVGTTYHNTDTGITYSKETGAGNTGWVAGTGIAATARTTNALLVNTGTTSGPIQELPLFTASDDTLTITAISSGSTSEIEFKSNLSALTGRIQCLHLLNSMNIESTAPTGNISITTTGGVTQIINQAGNASPILRLNNAGSNPAMIDIKCGSQLPEGNVTGVDGEVYLFKGLADSNAFVKTTASGTDGWDGLRNLPCIIAGMSRDTPLAPNSQILLAGVSQKCNSFAKNFEGVAGQLTPDFTNNDFKIHDVKDTVNGDLYKVHGTFTLQTNSIAIIRLDISGSDGLNPFTTDVVAEIGIDIAKVNIKQPISLNYPFRGPTALFGTGIIQLNITATVGTTVGWSTINLFIDRAPVIV